MNQSSSILAQAIDYGRRGWYVFPVKGKRPTAKYEWRKRSSQVEGLVRGDARIYAQASGFGLDCGKSGLVVIDIDNHNGTDGKGNWESLKEEEGFSDSGALEARTGSGGIHLFFKDTTGGKIHNSASKLAPGVDVRGNGGYIVLPGSTHPNGKLYEWIKDGAIPGDIPARLVEILLPPETEEKPVTQATRSRDASAWAEKAFDNVLAELASASQGERNDMLNKAAFSLGQLVGGGHLHHGEVENALTCQAMAVGLKENEIKSTVRSGMDGGVKSPRYPKDKERVTGRTGILVGNKNKSKAKEPLLEPIMPPLPQAACLPISLVVDACKWLDDYVEFSRKWSPRSFDGFHEACGLWILSTVAARRIKLNLGSKRYTPLFILLAARTSLYAKSSTADIAVDVLRVAGLDWLLAADESTPQKFIKDLTAYIPESYADMNQKKKDRLHKRLSLAGQRGWFYEEFGQHLHAMRRKNGHMAEFSGIIRRFDDCKESYEYGTIGRGTDFVERPYLALLGLLTPADLRSSAKSGNSMWGDGWWARFAFVTPSGEERERGRFPRGARIIPTSVVKPLKKWHDALGVADVLVTPAVNEEGETTGRMICELGPQEETSCRMGEGVFEAFYTYHDALLDLVEKSNITDLDGNYARFAEKALRVAMLFASLENDGQIELCHWAKAQEITERWRAGLHNLYTQMNTPLPSEEELRMEQIVKVLRKHGAKPMTPNMIARFMRGVKSGTALTPLLRTMASDGLLTKRMDRNRVRYSLPGTT